MFYYLGFASAGDLLAASGCLLGILYENYSDGQWSPLDNSLPFYNSWIDLQFTFA